MAVQTFHLINTDAGPQTLKSRAGDVFTIGAWVYPKAGNTGGGTIKLGINVTSSTGAPAGTFAQAASTTVPATGVWTYITGTVIVPAGYDTVDPVLTMTSVPAGDVIYLDDPLVREMTAAQNILDTLYQAVTGNSSAVNNTLAAINSQFTTWISNLFGASSIQTTISGGAIPALSASKITSGTFPQSMVTGLQAFYNAITGAGTAGSIMPDFQTIIDNLNKIITGSTSTNNPVTSWLTNLQSWATNLWGGTTLQNTLTGGVIPALSATKITSGNLLASVLPLIIPSANIPQLTQMLSADNLVLSPDFESTTLWSGAVGSQTTAQAHSGTHSWALNGAG